MTISSSSRPASPAAGGFHHSSLLSPRSYRLVDALGNPHPVLDDLYESHEAAWAEALQWWQSQYPSGQEPINIGVEVSTSNGNWRTIRHPGC